MASRRALSRFAADRRGATAIEYAVLIACIGVVLASALSVLQSGIYGVINTAATAVLQAIS